MLAGCQNLLRALLRWRHPYPAGQHGDLGPGRLQANLKLRAQYPRFTATRLHHEGLAGVGHAEKARTTPQLDMPFAMAVIHGDGTVGVEGDPGVIGQGEGLHLPRRRHVIGTQFIDPARRLPTGAHRHHRQQAGGNGQGAGPTRCTGALGGVHFIEVRLQGQRILIGQLACGYFAQLPQHLGLGVSLDMRRIGAQPAAERGLVAAAGLVMQQA